MGCGASKDGAGGDVVTTKPGGRFEDHYVLQAAELGKGQFSTVKRANEIATGREVAVKCIKKSEMTQEDIDALDIEKGVMRKLKGNPNLVQLFADYEDAEYHYLVMELARGGELFHKIVEREVYTEQQARDTIREITSAMKYCHDNGVVHRDLKPENVLLAAPGDETIKIADFGFAKELGTTPDGKLHTACGTPGYVAPEILYQRPYGPSVDIWSLGVIFYILLCGYPPFHSDKGQDHLFKKIKRADFQFDSPDWDDISQGAKDLISGILVAEPAKRLTASQILEHPWMTVDQVSAVPLGRARQNLVRFNARRKLKAAQKAVLSTVRMRRLLEGLRSAASSPEVSDAEGGAEGGAAGSAGGDANA